jgi:hypothetical protein
MVGWFCCFRPEVRQKYGGRSKCQRLLTSWRPGSRETEEGAWDEIYTSKAHSK